MPRLRNVTTGVVVNVDDDTAELLGSAYEPAEDASAGESDADRPSGNASREDWEAYALDNGFAADELEGLGRNEIRDLFD